MFCLYPIVIAAFIFIPFQIWPKCQPIITSVALYEFNLKQQKGRYLYSIVQHKYVKSFEENEIIDISYET